MSSKSDKPNGGLDGGGLRLRRLLGVGILWLGCAAAFSGQAASNGTVDPTENVKALMAASLEALAKLRDADKDISDSKYAHLKELAEIRALHSKTIGELREAYQEKISRAESGRLDSIRQVDREEVAKTAVSANIAITTLAKQTTDLQQTLAKQVTDTAAAQETRNSAQYSDINKRLSALELSSSEGKGKQTEAGPQLERLASMVEKLAAAQAAGGGKSEGISTSWTFLIAAVGLIAVLYGIYNSRTSRVTPVAPIVVPATSLQPPSK